MDKNDKEQNKEEISEVIKLIIIGSVSVGKTSLLLRYATGKFQSITKSTSTASFISKIKEVNGKLYEIKLWDTAGQEKYRSLTKIFIKDAKMALLVYAIDDENSFKDLDMWLNIVKEVNNEKIILGIAANKADLYDKAKVTDEQGKQYAKKIGASWSSTSSLQDDNGIDGLVDELLEKYLKIKGNNGNTNESKGITLSSKNMEENEKGGGCCGSKKEKKKNKNKINKKSEIVEGNDKYNEDEF
jgi:small GTP-binding protein